MDGITKKAWEVFRSVFTDGENVVVETSDGKFHYGKLSSTNESIILIRPRRKMIELSWDDIEFMAHDGFPVAPLMKMSASEAKLRGRQSPNQIIRDLLDVPRRLPEQIVTKEVAIRPIRAPSIWYGGGCPFIAGPARLIEIHNRGNTGPLYDYWQTDETEVLVFESADGARMQSYDTGHLFLLDKVA